MASRLRLRLPPEGCDPFCPSFLQGSIGYGRFLPHRPLPIHPSPRAGGNYLPSCPFPGSGYYPDYRLDRRHLPEEGGDLATGHTIPPPYRQSVVSNFRFNGVSMLTGNPGERLDITTHLYNS